MNQPDGDASSLETLALALGLASEPVSHLPYSFAVGAEKLDPESEIHIRPLTSEDPATELIGFNAPPEWNAMGVVLLGSGLIQMAGRSGEEICILQPADHAGRGGPPQHWSETRRLADVCRRTLGLSTPPPTSSTAELWAALWLDRLTRLVLDDPGCNPAWPLAARLHPAFELAGLVPTFSAHPEDCFVHLGRSLTTFTPWAYLRNACATGTWPVDGISAADAEWMDDGMFSRWTLGSFPLIREMLEPLEEQLPPATTCRIIDTLVAWDLW